MKILRPAAAFLGSAVLGYAGLAGYRHFTRPSISAQEAAFTEPASATSPDPSTGADRDTPPPELLAARECTGAALAVRLRAMFGQLGIDPEWADALAADDASAFPDLAEKLQAMPKSHNRERLSELFHTRWVALDPAGGAALLKSKNNKAGLTFLLGQWVLTDGPAALACSREYGDSWFQSTLNALAIHDPGGFQKWMAEHPEVNPFSFQGASPSNNQTALKRLLEADLARVLAWTKQFPETGWGMDTPRLLAAALARRSLDEALTWSKSLSDPDRTRQALMAVANVMADTQPEQALKLFAQIKDPSRDDLRQDSLTLFRKLGSIPPDKILETARSMAPGPVRATLVSGLLDDLMLRDPAQAFVLADSLGFEALPESSLGMPRGVVTAGQARQVLDAALNGDISVFRQRRATQAIGAWLETDQPALAAYLEGKINTPFFAELKLQEAIARTGMPLDPALDKVLGIRPEHEIAALVSDDPAAAMAGLARVKDPAARLTSIEKISEEWARHDQGEATAWAASLTDPEEQTTAWKSIAGQWLTEDPQQASSWVNSLPPGLPRDATVALLVDRILNRDPDLAWHWAGTLTDSGMKAQALGNAARAWQKTDAAALRGALDSPTLLTTEREAVLEQLRSTPAK